MIKRLDGAARWRARAQSLLDVVHDSFPDDGVDFSIDLRAPCKRLVFMPEDPVTLREDALARARCGRLRRILGAR
jgi:hypothetical protein